MRIGGLYEISAEFHCPFNLVYENVEIRIKCTYYSSYERRTLNIYCFEFKAVTDNNNKNREGLYERDPLYEREREDIRPAIL